MGTTISRTAMTLVMGVAKPSLSETRREMAYVQMLILCTKTMSNAFLLPRWMFTG